MFCEIVHDMRERRGETMVQFAARIGYSQGQVSKLESGSRMPSLGLIYKLIEVASADERLRILREVGFLDLDPLAMEVDRALKGEQWSSPRKAAFRTVLWSLLRAVS